MWSLSFWLSPYPLSQSVFCAGSLRSTTWIWFGGVHVRTPAEGEKAPSSPLIDCKMNRSFSSSTFNARRGKWHREAAIYFPCYHSLSSDSDILRGPRSARDEEKLHQRSYLQAGQYFHSLTCASCNRGILPLFIWKKDKDAWMKGSSHNQKLRVEGHFVWRRAVLENRVMIDGCNYQGPKNAPT